MNFLSGGRILLMGAPGFSGSKFEAVGTIFQFESRLLALPRGVMFEFQPLADFGAPRQLKRAFSVVKLGESQLHKIAPKIVAKGIEGVSESLWRAMREQIPETISRDLNMRLATEHVVYETARARRFAQFLRAARDNPRAKTLLLRAAGDQMIQSHFSLDHRWKIRCDEADELVKNARETGARNGVYGARLILDERGAGVAVLREK